MAGVANLSHAEYLLSVDKKLPQLDRATDCTLHRSKAFHTVAARRSHHAANEYEGPGPTVAVIGSGPAGFFTARSILHLLAQFQLSSSHSELTVDELV